MRRGKITSLLLAAVISLTPASSLAHGGRTDLSGGHRDNKNKSGLGSYHYHCGGYSAHLHKNGVCPYSAKTTSKSSTKSTSTSSTKKTSNTSTKKAEIKKAQEKLNELGYDCGTPDGNLGPKTKAAVKKFQKDKGLDIDGSIGPKTKKAMGV